MKIRIRGKKSFVVGKDDVIKGGELSPDKRSVYLNSDIIVEVVDKVGEFLATYSEVEVIERTKKGKEK